MVWGVNFPRREIGKERKKAGEKTKKCRILEKYRKKAKKLQKILKKSIKNSTIFYIFLDNGV